MNLNVMAKLLRTALPHCIAGSNFMVRTAVRIDSSIPEPSNLSNRAPVTSPALSTSMMTWAFPVTPLARACSVNLGKT